MKTPRDVATLQALRADVARQISRLIHREKLSQAAAAKRLRIPQRTVSKIVTGRVSGLSLDLLVRISVRAGLHLVLQTGAVPEEAGAFLSMSESSGRQRRQPSIADRAEDDLLEKVRAMSPEQRLLAHIELSRLRAEVLTRYSTRSPQ